MALLLSALLCTRALVYLIEFFSDRLRSPMEQLLLKNLQTLTSLPSTTSGSHRLLMKTSTLARTLLTNPNSSPETLRSAIETLTQSLHNNRQHQAFVRHAIKVIGEAAAIHRSLVPLATPTLLSFLNGTDPIAADALAVLDYLRELGALSANLVVSLASSAIVAVRLKIVRILVSNVSLLRPELMVRVFLGLATDLYSSVRKVAVDGVVELLMRDGDWIDGLTLKCCHDRAVDLLRDEDELLRLAAVRLVSECGRLFAIAEAGKESSDVLDVIFVQLCWMARDMSMKVRTETFIALGKVRLVSEGTLVQALSKKILGSKNKGGSLAECTIKDSKCPLSSSAGAFVHGIEDEFHEVRTAACKSLGVLSKFSIRFANEALNLLMDMLNDDLTAVRLQSLETLFQMAEHACLTMQEKHMHMFLGSLDDTYAVIRQAARKVLQLMRMPKYEMFLSSVGSLVRNLVTHPEEEADIFYVLFVLGKNNGTFAAKRIKEFDLEIVPTCGGELSLDSPLAAALLVLAISSSFSSGLMCDVSAKINSYSVPLFGRVSQSLRGVIHHNMLLGHLSHHSGMPFLAEMLKSKEPESSPCVVDDISDGTKQIGQIFSSSRAIHHQTSDLISSQNLFNLSEVSISFEQSRLKETYLDGDSGTALSLMLIFKSVRETWQLIQSQCTFKAQRILRSCKEELEMVCSNAAESNAALLAFVMYYIQVMQLFGEIWDQLQPKLFIGMTALDLLLNKLSIYLKQMRNTFSGLSIEMECHVLELTLLGDLLKIYNTCICSSVLQNKLQTVSARIESLSIEGSLKLSNFHNELKKLYIGQRTSEVPQPFRVLKLVQLFCFEQISLDGGLRHIKAELSTSGSNSENPLPFVSGLPVGILFHITLHNISDEHILWLRMAVGKLVQYAFLDICQFEGSDQQKKNTVELPFCAAPKVASFLLRASVCMECPLDGIMHSKKGQGGPRYDVTLLSEEIDVYLTQIGQK